MAINRGTMQKSSKSHQPQKGNLLANIALSILQDYPEPSYERTQTGL